MHGLVIKTALLLVGSAAFGLLVNAVRPGGVSYEWQPTAECDLDKLPVPEVSPREASGLCRSAKVLVVDVRPQSLYEQGHLPDAMHLPCNRSALEEAAQEQLSSADAVLIYGQDTESAVVVARALLKQNYPVRVLQGGYPKWEGEGLACASGPCEACSERAHVEH